MLSTSPLGLFAVTHMPPFSPSFIGRIVTVSLSPGFRVVRLQPRRARKLGLIPSTPHVSLPPLSFGTSIQNHVCGLVQSTFFTDPEMTLFIVVSKAAKE